MRYSVWNKGGQRVRLPSGEVFVSIRGSGPPLLFFHGFPTTSFDYAGVIERLETKHRCIAFDFAGFGDSDPPARYDLRKQADLALEVAAHAGLDHAVLVAHDYGASVAQELMARGKDSPLRLDGVVFLNGGLDPTLHRPLLIQRLLAGPIGAVLAPLLVRKRIFVRSMRRILVRLDRFDADEHWAAMSSRGAHRRTHHLLHYMKERPQHRDRWVRAFADRSRSARTAAPYGSGPGPRTEGDADRADPTDQSIPIALAWGTADPVSGAHVLSWARGARPDAEVLGLPVGHYPQLEATEEVAEFIAQLAARCSTT